MILGRKSVDATVKLKIDKMNGIDSHQMTYKTDWLKSINKFQAKLQMQTSKSHCSLNSNNIKENSFNWSTTIITVAIKLIHPLSTTTMMLSMVNTLPPTKHSTDTWRMSMENNLMIISVLDLLEKSTLEETVFTRLPLLKYSEFHTLPAMVATLMFNKMTTAVSLTKKIPILELMEVKLILSTRTTWMSLETREINTQSILEVAPKLKPLEPTIYPSKDLISISRVSTERVENNTNMMAIMLLASEMIYSLTILFINLLFLSYLTRIIYILTIKYLHQLKRIKDELNKNQKNWVR